MKASSGRPKKDWQRNLQQEVSGAVEMEEETVKPRVTVHDVLAPLEDFLELLGLGLTRRCMQSEVDSLRSCLSSMDLTFPVRNLLDRLSGFVPASDEEGDSGLMRKCRRRERFCHPSFVQITASKSELDSRISAFMARKRAELDETNRQEFCEPSRDGSTCARTSPADVRRISRCSHIRLVRSVNTRTDDPPVDSPAAGKSGKSGSVSESWTTISDRLDVLEAHIDVSKKVVPSEIYQRVRGLENRLLQLEARSPEYLSLYKLLSGDGGQERPKPASSSLPDYRPSNNVGLFSAHPYGRPSHGHLTWQRPAPVGDASVSDDTENLDNRIAQLKEVLRAKSRSIPS